MANLEQLSVEKNIGTFNGITYSRIKGRFSGKNIAGQPYSVPYEMTSPVGIPQPGGRVVVEPPHFAEGTIVLNNLSPDFLFGRGMSHASVGYSFRGKRILDPNPGFDIIIKGDAYNPNNNVIDYEIIAQFANALRRMSRSRKVYSAGFSDSGTAVRNVLKEKYGKGAFDLSFPGLAGSLNLVDDREKVMAFNSEADYVAVTVSSSSYRSYAFAGAPHIADNKSSRNQFPDPPVAGSPAPPVAGTTPIDWLPFFKALFVAGDEWITQGKEPPSSNVFEMTPSGNIARDEMCNAIGGIRHPALKLPEARFIASIVRGKGWELFGAYGNVRRLGVGEFKPYLDAFEQAAKTLVDARYLLEKDATDWIKKAGLTPETRTGPGKTFTQNYMAGLFDELKQRD